ncbi:dienelactone hydrolase family protein [Anderseniella sp. Alg231-50]|uniref:dienelactone hydrolase family protein n=1 Tax=Anderseniella sp. Alg231-50 TaxID=1922226 RepID=UPI00307B1312
MIPATGALSRRLIVSAVVLAGLFVAQPVRAEPDIQDGANRFASGILNLLFPKSPPAETYSGNTTGLHNSTKTFARPEDMIPSDWTDPAEMRRAWNAAIVHLPHMHNKYKKSFETSAPELLKGEFGFTQKLPVVIYMHGCSGFWSGTHMRTKFLAENGFVVVAPASLARKKYPRSCQVDGYTAGMYRQTLKMRQADAGYAIEQVRKLPFVDADRIVLMGLSQGGITAATFQPQNKRQKVRARIIEGWTCHDDWPEYNGLRAPTSEPVLALVGSKDPWFQSVSRGDCQPFLHPDNGSSSVVYKDEPLASRHELLEFTSPKKAVVQFLRRHVDARAGVDESGDRSMVTRHPLWLRLKPD